MIMVVALVTMMSAGLEALLLFSCLDKYNCENCNQNSFSQSVPGLFRKQIFIHSQWKSELLHILKINEKSQAETMKDGK